MVSSSLHYTLRNHLFVLSSRLREGEKILYVNALNRSIAHVGRGRSKSRPRFGDMKPGVLVVTDQRIFHAFSSGKGVLGQSDVQDIMLKDIVAVESESRPLKSGLVQVFTLVYGFQFECPPKQTEVLLRAINDARAAAIAPVQTITAQSASDIPSQIRKLSELHDAGILSDEEFKAKKQELLARM